MTVQSVLVRPDWQILPPALSLVRRGEYFFFGELEKFSIYAETSPSAGDVSDFIFLFVPSWAKPSPSRAFIKIQKFRPPRAKLFVGAKEAMGKARAPKPGFCMTSMRTRHGNFSLSLDSRKYEAGDAIECRMPGATSHTEIDERSDDY